MKESTTALIALSEIREKVKAYFEIEIWDDRHPLECGCVPCRIVRGIVAKVLNSRPAPLDGEVKVFIAR